MLPMNEKKQFLHNCVWKHQNNQQVSYRIQYVNNIITIYFENVTFLHAKLGSDVCPRVYSQTSGDTLQDLQDHYWKNCHQPSIYS